MWRSTEENWNVPTEMWREILIRLPGAECVVRSRAVCKGWRAVIDDPSFFRALTNKQLMISSSNKPSMIIIQHSTYNGCFDLEAVRFSSNGQQSIAARSVTGEKQVGACNGLLLMENPLQIKNPLTRERLVLPGRPREIECSVDGAFGLGYDYRADDYKAVVYSLLKESLSARRTYVYSLKSDTWKRINNCPCDSEWPGPSGPGVFVCGALNWLSVGEGFAYGDKIVSLDLGTEEYRMLQMPRSVGRRVGGMKLDVLGGSLVLYANKYNGGSFSCSLDVWVKKQLLAGSSSGDENDEGWTKLFCVGEEQHVPWAWGFLWPVAFITKEEEEGVQQVFLQTRQEDLCNGTRRGNRFFMFDVVTNSMKRVFIHDLLEDDLCAKPMSPRTIFRLHANCGGGARPTRPFFCTGSSSARYKELVFCIRDHAKAHDDDQDSCYTRQQTTTQINSSSSYTRQQTATTSSSEDEEDDHDWNLFY